MIGHLAGNPVVRREFLGMLRTRRALTMLTLVAGLFTLLVIVRWPGDSLMDMSGARAREVFIVLSYGLLTVVTLMSPVFPATSVVHERQSGTMELLLNSPLPPVSIYLGKLAGLIGFNLLLLSVTLPAAAACYTMGGVSIVSEVIPLYGVLFCAALFYASFGLMVSTYAGSIDSALRFSLAGVLGMCLLSPVPNYFFEGTASPFAPLATWLRFLSPIPAVMELVGHGDVGAKGLIGVSGGAALRFLLWAGLGTLACSGLTLRRLNHSMFDRSRSQGVITDDLSLAMRIARRFVFLVDPQRRKRGIAPFVNPVMVKEFRCRQFGRFHWLMRLICACAVLSLALAIGATTGTVAWGVDTIGGFVATLQVALIVALTPGLAAGLFSAERESGGWDLLQMTPLSPGRILRGKLLSVLWTLLLVLCATLPGYAVMIYIDPMMREQVTQVIICLVLTAVFAIMLSATVSSLMSRTAPATATSYGLLLVLWAGSLLVWAGRDAPFGYSTVKAALSVNPLAAALSVIGTAGFTRYQLVPLNWWILSVATVCLLLVLVFRLRRLSMPR